MTAVTTTARNAALGDLAEILQRDHARKVDVVAPASAIRSEEGNLVLKGTEAVITADGVTQADGVYISTAIADEGVADKLGIPISYLRTLHRERPDLYDANVNGLLNGRKGKMRLATMEERNDGGIEKLLDASGVARIWERQPLPGDSRSFLVRCFRGDDGPGVARAFLSDRYAVVDNFDVLTAALSGLQSTGVEHEIVGCDLTDRRMVLKVAAPSVLAMAPELLKGYRNPFADPEMDAQRNHGWSLERGREAAAREGLGFGGGTEPIVFAGFLLTNSETGNGAFTITPRLVVQVCKNGLVINVDAMRQVHLGARLDEGIVSWSAETQAKNLELITLKARDAVAEFLSADYLTRAVAKLEEKAGKRIDRPADAIKVIGKKLAFTDAEIAGVLDFYVQGGSMTAGGLMNAVTAYAQIVPDADEAHQLESVAVRALELAAA